LVEFYKLAILISRKAYGFWTGITGITGATFRIPKKFNMNEIYDIIYED